MTVGSAKIDASLTPSEGSFQQVDFKVSSTNECNIQKTGIKLPKGEASVDLKSPDILTESSSVVDGRKMKLEGPEGKVKMPKFQKPKFGISLTKGKGPETEISSPKIEAELPQLKMTDEIADIAVGVPASELASDMSDPGVVDSKIKTPQALIGGIEVAKVDISTHSVSKPKTEGVTKSLEEKEIKLKEHEIKAEEVQTEEYQGWFKMPKFRIPGFSKSSIKEKKSDAGIERRTEKAQATIPAGIQKLGDSVKSSDVSLPKIEGDISLSTESSDSRVNIPKTETYADVVKRSAEGHTSEITMSAAELSKSYPSASESDKDNSSTERFPTCTLTFPEHEVKSQDTEVPKAESSMKAETKGSIGLRSPALDHMEASARITGGTVDITQGVPEVSVRIPKLKIPRFTFRTLPIEADVLLSKVVTDPKGSSTDIEMTATIQSSLSSAGQDIHWSYTEGQEVSEKVEPEHVAIERCEIYTTEIVKESEILSSEVKTATLGFSLLKAKLPESRSDLEVLIQQPSPTGGASARKPKGAGESFGTAAQRTGSAELKPSNKLHHESEVSREVSLTKFKTSAAEVKYSSKPEESFPDKSPEGIAAGPLSKGEDVVEVVEGEEKDITTEKEKTDSKRSPGRFKFWLPSVGFSSSGDETSTDTKPEIKKSVPEDVKPADVSDDSSQQTEKTGWFRFPKLGFTSPSKKAKSVDKEEVGHKEGRLSDEDSPTDKPDVFFDAQESLSPKEITESEKAEIDGASSIVTSSARTELILLEEGKDSKSNIVGDTTK
uniref:Protein AHNAK2 n=1 Tax=Malurus cyaneus samueli TaxID=2593467 RepID=A0A8C5TZL3_9PASS